MDGEIYRRQILDLETSRNRREADSSRELEYEELVNEYNDLVEKYNENILQVSA